MGCSSCDGLLSFNLQSSKATDTDPSLTIGNTPLIRINSLSSLTGVNILGKAEFLNPGGSIKDRVALRILTDAEQSGLLYPNTGSMVFEGSVGSTGISFALLCRAKGYGCTVVMPDDVAMEKVEVLERLGATVKRVRPGRWNRSGRRRLAS